MYINICIPILFQTPTSTARIGSGGALNEFLRDIAWIQYPKGSSTKIGAYMSVRQYSLYKPVPWTNWGGPIAFAGFGADGNGGFTFGGFCHNVVTL